MRWQPISERCVSREAEPEGGTDEVRLVGWILRGALEYIGYVQECVELKFAKMENEPFEPTVLNTCRCIKDI